MRQIEALEAQRAEIASQIADLDNIQATSKALSELSAADVRRLLGRLMEDMAAADPEIMRDALRSLVERIELSSETYEAVIHYSIGPATKSGEWMASPRGFEPRLPP